MERKNTYSGRFGENKSTRPAPGTQRKPSGFNTAGQTPRKSDPRPAPEGKPPKKQPKIKQEKIRRTKVKRKGTFRRVLVGCLVALLAALILLVIFGDRGTYHQLPTITREEPEGSFEPEVTPLPGVEEAI